jgi:transposase-like protein
VKVRQGGRIVSVATIIAVAVNTEGRREVLGMATGPSEAEPFWTAFLRSLTRRGLRGVKLVISDAHEGLKAAVAKVLKASWQRCRVHFLRNALAYANKSQRQMVFALINTIFAQRARGGRAWPWRILPTSCAKPRLAAMMDGQHGAPSWTSWDHRVKSTDQRPQRLNGDFQRRADVVGIFPHETRSAAPRAHGAERRCDPETPGLESLATMSENPPIRLPAAPALA